MVAGDEKFLGEVMIRLFKRSCKNSGLENKGNAILLIVVSRI